MKEIPYLNEFTQIVNQTENDYEIVIETYHVPLPHQVSKWINAGWIQRAQKTFAYPKIVGETEIKSDLWEETLFVSKDGSEINPDVSFEP
jgi:hypothetical protein